MRAGSMNAGKSTALLQVAFNYEEQGLIVELYTAAIDDRYTVGQITSRIGLSREAKIFDANLDFLSLANSSLSCVLIDECQFLTEAQVTQLHKLAHLHNIPVICFGIRSDFQGNPFPGAARLMCLADDIEELKTICSCGSKASMNVRVSEEGIRIREGAQVSIGGNATYKQVCPKCFYSGE
ncbi:MAG: thymidine kinase [Agitococcus sp.]|nr:thymidine kinase [Agitococcus sp.]